MIHNFIINDFEGPLDLLLHLIKQSKMDIYDIKIEDITNQYIKYINSMKDLNIDVASEYLVMASELLNLKSRFLLNLETEEDNDEENDISSIDDLQRKLIEYDKYKNVGNEFRNLESKRNEIYTKDPSSVNEYIDEELRISETTTVNDLLNAFALFLERQKLQKPIKTRVVGKEYNIEQRNKEIMALLEHKNKIEFSLLFDILTKDYIIATFLSILDLAKKEEVLLEQANNFDKIYIVKK